MFISAVNYISFTIFRISVLNAGRSIMLEKVDLERKVSKREYKNAVKTLKEQLTALDGPMKEADLPVIIIFEGWPGAGKGSLIQKLIQNFDPRWYRVVNTQPPTDVDLREPMMWRHWATIPENGKITIMNRSWYQEVSTMRVDNHIDELTNLRHMNEINSFEHGLVENGYLIVKFFIHITQDEMKKRQDALLADKNTAWRVSETDRKRLKDFDKYVTVTDSMLEYTNLPFAPWHVISGMDQEACTLDVFSIVVDSVQTALKLRADRNRLAKESRAVIQPGQYRFVEMPLLADIDLDKSLTDEEYRKELKKEQEKLTDYHNRLYRHRIPMIICYEGWDAAGKGGNIKRVTAALDPRGYEVMPIASPTPDEKNRHFLYRFWRRLPKDGHIAIFDRTWYGRVMVERLEGFCTTADWQRAYGEINDFERQLYDWGAIIVKFWIHISNEEQLVRFQARQENPDKRWKITDEDWRNREKWPQYEVAVNDMLKYTSTDFAPWTIVEGNDKKYARVKALKTINAAIEARLKEVEKDKDKDKGKGKDKDKDKSKDKGKTAAKGKAGSGSKAGEAVKAKAKAAVKEKAKKTAKAKAAVKAGAAAKGKAVTKGKAAAKTNAKGKK